MKIRFHHSNYRYTYVPRLTLSPLLFEGERHDFNITFITVNRAIRALMYYLLNLPKLGIRGNSTHLGIGIPFNLNDNIFL